MSSPVAAWSAIERASRREVPRIPFVIDRIEAGSVAVVHAEALRGLGTDLQVDNGRVTLRVPPDRRDAALAGLNAALRARGLIRAWRDEPFGVPDPSTLQVLAVMERAAARFWGTLTFGAHCTGWVRGGPAQPPRLWIAQRSLHKATDPGAFDNLVGGGVPLGQTPYETLLREGWEEAGLVSEVMRRARPGRVLRLLRDIPEGLQHEWIHGFDLELLPAESPLNQDGEVHAFRLHDAVDALAIAAADTMTVDASLVTLDFALRHGLLAPAAAAGLEQRAARLWVTP